MVERPAIQQAGAPNRDDSSQAQNRKIWRDVQTVSDGLDSTNIRRSGVALLTSRVTLRDSASMLLPRTCLLMCGRRGVWVLMR
jgi:hypothetical protein